MAKSRLGLVFLRALARDPWFRYVPEKQQPFFPVSFQPPIFLTADFLWEAGQCPVLEPKRSIARFQRLPDTPLPLIYNHLDTRVSSEASSPVTACRHWPGLS